jgi:hypothetical protein
VVVLVVDRCPQDDVGERCDNQTTAIFDESSIVITMRRHRVVTTVGRWEIDIGGTHDDDTRLDRHYQSSRERDRFVAQS